MSSSDILKMREIPPLDERRKILDSELRALAGVELELRYLYQKEGFGNSTAITALKKRQRALQERVKKIAYGIESSEQQESKPER